jgi:very-short-patch-repair endonuclease
MLGHMPRPLMQLGIDALERMAASGTPNERQQVMEELTHRSTDRARRLAERLGTTQPASATTQAPAPVQLVIPDVISPPYPASQPSRAAVAPPDQTVPTPAPTPRPTSTTTAAVPTTTNPPSPTGGLVTLRNGIWRITAPAGPPTPPPSADLVDQLMTGSTASIADVAPPPIPGQQPHRIRGLFEFIKAWHHSTTPPPRRLEHYQDVRNLHELTLAPPAYVRLGTDLEARAEGVIAEVKRPPTDAAPAIPAILRGWVAGATQDPTNPPGLHQRLSQPGGAIEQLDASPQRMDAGKNWCGAWQRWAAEELVRQPVRQWYNALFAMRGKLEGRSHELELVLGVGVLTWTLPGDQAVNHPLLVRRVSLDFDDTNAIATIRDSDAPVEFSGACLGHTDLAGPPLGAATQYVADQRPHPLDADRTGVVLSAVLNRWFGGLDFSAAGIPKPSLRWQPTLFIRQSGSRVVSFVDGILRRLETPGVEVPPCFDWITGDRDPPTADDSGGGLSGGSAGETGSGTETTRRELLDTYYFTKPHNLSQRRIAALIERYPGVQVQGPPGTGKTHSIGNLIGHFLAKGWRVLVTSATSKALGEVQNQVARDLRPLCVPLLDNDADGRHLLQGSLQAIAARTGTHDRGALRRDIERLATQRTALHAQYRQLEDLLLDCRRDEHQAILVGTRSYSPEQAARLLAEPGPDIIPGPLAPHAEAPLDDASLAELYASNALISPDQEALIATATLPPEQIPTAEALHGFLTIYHELARVARQHQPTWWIGNHTIAQMQDVYDRADRATAPLQHLPPWLATCLDDARRGSDSAALWRDLIVLAERVGTAHARVTAARIDGSVTISDPQPDRDVAALTAAIGHLRQGGSLRRMGLMWFDRTYGERVNQWKVRGAAPKTIADHEILLALAEHDVLAARMQRAWAMVVERHGGPPLTATPERVRLVHAEDLDRIAAILTWADQGSRELQQALRSIGYQADKGDAIQPTTSPGGTQQDRQVRHYREVLLPALAGRIAKQTLAAPQPQEAASRAMQTAAHTAPHGAEAILYAAWKAGDVPAYGACRERYVAAWAMRAGMHRRSQLLQILAVTAPAWASAIRQRQPPHDAIVPPERLGEAWERQQIREELDRRHSRDPNLIQRDLLQIEADIERATCALVAAMAWDRQLDRMSGSAGTALKTWSSLMKQIGAGTGKQTARLQSEARQQMVDAQPAVPVWIMPIWRIFETVDPVRSDPFDVVIIDESSQSDLRGVPIWWTAKRVIVVGDEEQVTPSAVGQNVDAIAQLQQQHLTGYRSPAIWSGRQSLYGIAGIHFGCCHVTLTEHFRCHPDIIAFSDSLCYAGKNTPLQAMRSADQAPYATPLVECRVQASTAGGEANHAEAHRVMALMQAMLAHPAYANRTFGIIGLVGTDQTDYIDREIRTRLNLDADTIERLKGGGRGTRRLCGKPPDFQGDERDVIILTMVDRPRTPPGPLHRLSQEMFLSRYNVAVSRARHQVWLVHSLDPATDLQPGDLRRTLIDHVRDPSVIRRRLESAVQEAESPFERDVLSGLISAGYHVRPQHPVGAYRIDMLVSDGERQLAVECDGERWHGPERTMQDLERQRVLERLGYRFHRIRGSRFYRDKTGAMRDLLAHLHSANIQPHAGPAVPQPTATDVVTEEVRRTADRIMAQWLGATVQPSP